MSIKNPRATSASMLVALTLLSVFCAQAWTKGAPPAQASEAGLLLIVSMDESKVDIVDEATAATLASLSTGARPHEVRVAPDGRTAYVVAGQTITGIDLASRTVTRTYDLGDHAAHDVRISRDGRRLWAACARTRTVLEIETATGTVLERYPTERDGAWFVEVSRDESTLYTPNLEGKSVSVITRASKAVKVLPLEYEAYGIDITADGGQAVVSGRGLAVLDTRTDTLARRIETSPPETGRIRITPDGRRVVVAMTASVLVFDLAGGTLLKSISLPASPKVMALSGDGRRAYLTNPEDHSATIADLDAGRVVSTVKTGRRPDGIAWAPKVRP